jgi:AcrR family transcriptional regulator
MPRPVTISDDVILDAARATFLEKGPKATTAEIAARAGVSEGILFKRYGSKGALMRAAMVSGRIGALIEQEIREQAPLRTRKDFERLVRWQMGVLSEVVPMVVMAWSARSQTDQLPPHLTGPNPAPLVAVRTLAAVLEEEMARGHLVRRRAEAVARILVGSVWHFVFLRLVFEEARGIDEDTFVEELARMVFADLDPSRVSARRGRASSR